MKKILNILFAVLTLTALTMFTGCPEEDGGGSGSNGDGGGGGGDAFEPSSVITLTETVWTNGTLTAGSEQWFDFTATAATQYIHVNPGTLTDFYVQLYKSDGSTVGSKTNLYSNKKYYKQTLVTGQVYYIKVTPYSSSGKGTYQITFSTSFIPTAITTLTTDVWADGILTTNGEQWFKFNATAATQYIHLYFGTLNWLTIIVYTSNGDLVKTSDSPYSSGSTDLTDSSKYTTRNVTSGQDYYIKVTPAGPRYGTYQITFNTSNTPPTAPLLHQNATSAIQLTLVTWADGNVATSTDEQWFKFTATATTHYVHPKFGTIRGMSIRLYDKDGKTLGSQTDITTSSSSAKYVTQASLTINEEYYIRVWPYSSSYNGTFQIMFSTLPIIPVDVTTINNADTWTNGNIPTKGGEQWFKFTATANTQYIHVDYITLPNMYFQLYKADDGSKVGDYKDFLQADKKIDRPVNIGDSYYIKIYVGNFDSGTYKIAFNDSTTPPVITLPTDNVTQLTLNIWANTTLPAESGAQWFKFTATAATQYIRVYEDSLFGVYLQLYDASGNTVGEQGSYSGTKYISRTLNIGQEYHIKTWNYPGNNNITYKIGFSESLDTILNYQ